MSIAANGDHLLGHVLFARNLLDPPKRLVDVQVLSPLAFCLSANGKASGAP